MSSMRNALQRRSHRERGQLTNRKHLGLLEKHKDYSLRAADYNKKKATLKSLRKKAAERNEDEFDFGMLSRAGPGNRLSNGKSWVGTINGDRGNSAMSMETVRLLKTQDMGYIRTARNVAAKEVRRLEERVILVGGTLAGTSDEVGTAALPPAKKIRFMDDHEEREAALADEQLHEEASDTNADLDVSDEEGSEASSDDGKSPLDELLQQLQRARERLKALTDAEDAVELQQARMAKTATVGGITKKGKVFKVRQRKR